MIADRHPMIHAMTNAVTRTDVVNMILASGGSAICSENSEEAAQITALCQGLLINTGMPDERRLEAMILSGREANERKIPVVLDPAGLGASEYQTCRRRRRCRECQSPPAVSRSAAQGSRKRK